MGLEVRGLSSCNPSAETLWTPGKRQDREGKREVEQLGIPFWSLVSQ